jgi:hypothetical protein
VFEKAFSRESHRRVWWSPEWQGVLQLNRRVAKTYRAFSVWVNLFSFCFFLKLI